MKKLLLWGAGGHGTVVLDCAIAMAAFDGIAFLDDRVEALRFHCGHPILGTRAALDDMRAAGYTHFVVSIGANRVRATCFDIAITHGLEPATIVHPSAVVSRWATVGVGTVVAPRVSIKAGTVIGRNCIINTSAAVGHDCTVGDHVHLSPRSFISGGTKVGPYAHVSIAAVTRPLGEIGEAAVVGAGAVVIGVVPAGATVIGVPARPMPVKHRCE
jgi:sugar O-acyltransferase (sialic acid O-acetyltransferase NeuD family)